MKQGHHWTTVPPPLGRHLPNPGSRGSGIEICGPDINPIVDRSQVWLIFSRARANRSLQFHLPRCHLSTGRFAILFKHRSFQKPAVFPGFRWFPEKTRIPGFRMDMEGTSRILGSTFLSARPRTLLSPKSVSLAWPSASSSTFSGFRSPRAACASGLWGRPGESEERGWGPVFWGLAGETFKGKTEKPRFGPFFVCRRFVFPFGLVERETWNGNGEGHRFGKGFQF